MIRAVLLLSLLIIGCARNPPPVEVRLLWQRNYQRVTPADLDGDSTDEFVCVQDGYVLDCLSQDMKRTVGGTLYGDTGAFSSGMRSAGGSKAAGIWYTYVRRDSLFLFSSKAGSDLFVTSGRDREPPVGWDGGASDVMVRDRNGSGDIEAAVVVYSRMDAYPRGIYVLDYSTGRRLWSYETGPSITTASSVDVDNDSRTEILLGSAAWKNGGTANGTSDDSSYGLIACLCG